MNGRVSKMLRKMRRSSKIDKRLWNWMSPEMRGIVSSLHKGNTKLMHIDYMPKIQN